MTTDPRSMLEDGADAAKGGADRDRDRGVRRLALIALTAVGVGLCVWLAVPLLPAITWGVALAILAMPMHRRIARWVTWPGVAAGLSTAIVTLIIAGTGAFVAYRLGEEAAGAARRAAEASDRGELDVHEEAAKVPVLGRAVVWMERRGLDIEAEARALLGSYAGDVAALARGSATAAIQFLVMAFILFYLFRDRDAFLRGVRSYLPLTGPEADSVLQGGADSIHANLYATAVVSLINTVGFGVLWWWFDLPAPLLWSSVMFVLALVPILGAGFVWGPAAIYLALAGRWLACGALVAWGVVSFVAVGNVLYARLAGGRMKMHDVPALIAFLGGLAAFGLSGMVLGPAIVGVTAALIEVWRRRVGDRSPVLGP